MTQNENQNFEGRYFLCCHELIPCVGWQKGPVSSWGLFIICNLYNAFLWFRIAEMSLRRFFCFVFVRYVDCNALYNDAACLLMWLFPSRMYSASLKLEDRGFIFISRLQLPIIIVVSYQVLHMVHYTMKGGPSILRQLIELVLRSIEGTIFWESYM